MVADRLNDLTKNKTNIRPVVDRNTEVTAEDFEDIGRVTENHANILDSLTGAASPNKNYGVYTSLSLLEAAHPVGEPNSYAIIDVGSGTTPQIAIWNDTTNQWVIVTPNEYVIYVASFSNLPAPGVSNKIYITLNDFKSYIWQNSRYNILNNPPAPSIPIKTRQYQLHKHLNNTDPTKLSTRQNNDIVYNVQWSATEVWQMAMCIDATKSADDRAAWNVINPIEGIPLI
ncbi:hypothetical protein [Tenacibaculum soleae]|uniref:hypothetical protein n=1 Tax=Tenacibaculum soleae TaxID=447689 RepID=UPI0026E1BA05|nr:hypothetical protein [Tenacibaculum soleae]MDO6813827.1 hypothetical protein [Tenacibaculum soleae]